MNLLPFDLIVTVGMSAAVFLLGLSVWWRNRGATGNALFSLLALSLSLWTSADWILRLQATAAPVQVLSWKILFYFAACMSPAFVVHAAAHISRRLRHGAVGATYLFSFSSFVCVVIGLALRLLQAPGDIVTAWLTSGAVLALALYVSAVFLAAIELYPIVQSGSSSRLDHRRAAYGLVILIPFIVSGALQFIIGPVPTGFLMPFFAAWFLVFSLAAFIRASFLDVEFGPLEAFFLLLSSVAVIVLLRSRDRIEAIVTVAGMVAVGAFGLLAIRTVREERVKRQRLEATNRELRLVDEAKRDFVDMVAHQLRSPLGGIRSSASMLASGDYGPLPDKARDAARMIQDAGTRLLSLADTFLDESRLDLGVYVSRAVPTSVRRELAALVQEMSSMAKAKRLTLSMIVADDVPERLVVDREVLVQTVFNLLDNAIKYTDRGEVAVSCRIEDKRLRLDVRDTGNGLTGEELRQLFKKFHRGNVGHAHTVDGTGLGLYIVKRLVEAAGGTIAVESQGPGNGSTFSVRLPVAESH